MKKYWKLTKKNKLFQKLEFKHKKRKMNSIMKSKK